MFFLKKKPIKPLRVSICVSSEDTKFNNGRQSRTLTLYDTTPEEVFKMIEDGLKEHAEIQEH